MTTLVLFIKFMFGGILRKDPQECVIQQIRFGGGNVQVRGSCSNACTVELDNNDNSRSFLKVLLKQGLSLFSY